MPASMIRPDTGSRWKVSGSSIAMVAIGPMPGSTPIRVPTMAPMKAKPRLAGVSATPNPIGKLSKNSIALPVGPDRDGEPQPDDENGPGQRDQRDCGDGGFEQAQAPRRQRADACQQQDGDDEAEALEAQAESDEAERDGDHRAPRLR